MTTEVIESPFAGQQASVLQPVGALVAIEQQRAIAEIQARMMIARANPRDEKRAMDKIMQACMRPTLAEVAIYQYARGGSDVSGPSIKLAESIARDWGNIASGIKEVSRANGYSECVAYAWDLETGFYDERQFQIRHWRDTKKGGYALTDERDIYELTANMGQRRKRAVLLTVLPGDVVEAARAQCELTLRAKADTSPEAMKKLVDAFAEFEVTKEMIEKRIQRRIDAIQPAQVVNLRKIYASLRDDMSTPTEWFEFEPTNTGGQGSGAPTAKEKPAYPEAMFKKNVENWRAMIHSGQKTADDIAAMVASKGTLSAEQLAALNAPAEPPALGGDQQGQGGDGTKVGASILEGLRAKAKRAAITEAEICKHLGVKSLDTITAEQVEQAIAFINDPVGGGK
jgi:hypothetical protein